MPAVPTPAKVRPTLSSPALRFGVRAAAWTVALLGVMRLRPIEAHAILPFTIWQAKIAAWHIGHDQLPVVASLECSGADVIALTLAATLAYPASWRARLAGAVLSVVWLAALNTVRLATLGLAVGTSAFQPLHLQVWPILLIVGALVFLASWIRVVDGAGWRGSGATGAALTRFAVWAVALVIVFQALAPWWMTSQFLVAMSAATARLAGALLNGIGVTVTVSGAILSAPHGTYLVTPECITTPLMPIYLAAVLALSVPTTHRLVAILAFGPIFAALAVARLLTVAIPPVVGASSIILTHAFHQIVLGVIVLGVVAWSRDEPRSWRGTTSRALLALAAAIAAALAGGAWYTTAIEWVARHLTWLAPHALTELAIPGDVQGAWLLLPGYQLGLGVALLVAGRRHGFGTWAATLALITLGSVVALLAAGEVQALASITVPTLAVRGWSVVWPVAAVTAAVWLTGRHRRAEQSYLRFWEHVGERFPDLGGAASTAYYRANEERLLREHLPDLAGRRLLKTDLWDEARNTRILGWARAAAGARVYGVDISAPIVKNAAQNLGPEPLPAPVADVRQLPFPDATFDAVYSMGTIEHFDESEQALREIARVLKPGGRAIVGVPNRHDPFLRPLLVAVLYRLGAYGYGFEKSFSRRALAGMMQRAGLDVVAETGILFVPGWLRMMDLVCYCWCRPLARVTAISLAPFVWLDRYVPAVRRHGYLLASVGVRRPTPASEQTGETGCRAETQPQ